MRSGPENPEEPSEGPGTQAPFTCSASDVELAEAWVEGEAGSRWHSAAGHGAATGAAASGSSFLEVEPGHRLARHVDSAEETVVVVTGVAEVALGGRAAQVEQGGVALVPAGMPHEVRNAGDGMLRFVAVYAAPEVTTTYVKPVQPDGERTRDPLP